MVEAQEKILAFDNQFFEFGTQTVEGVDCVVTPFPVIAPENNLVTLKLTQGELREILSSIQIGSEWAYPDKSHQILFNFMKGMICAPELVAEDGDCLNYPNYAPFITYEPSNPFNQPDLVPPDYTVPPFLVNSELEYPELFGYLATDVFVPIGALTIDPLNFITLNYPTIKITVVGSGQIELDLLAVSFGGYAVVKVGSPPNIGDILGEIIIESGLRVIDLDNDSASIPPETDIIISEEINIEAETGVVTDVYIVFLPKLNDSLIPLGFGGGFRQVGLCGFEELAESDTTVQDVRYNEETGDLEKLVLGDWVIFATCEQLIACAPEGGGGGASSSLSVSTYGIDFANQDTTSTTMVKATGTAISHTFTKSKALVLAEFMSFNNGANNTYAEVRVAGNLPVVANPSRRQLNANSTMVSSGSFEGIALGARELAIYFSAQAGTARIVGAARCVYTVIEYEDASDLFVEDIQVLADGTIQKKIGGVWLDVSIDLATLFDALQADITAAAAAAAAAQTTANTATTVNSAQAAQIAALITENTTQNGQIAAIQVVNTAQAAILTAHEARLDDIDLSIAGLIVEQAAQNGRLDDLEAITGGTSGLGAWGGYRLRAVTDINANGGKYSSSTNTWDNGSSPFIFVGWEPNGASVVKVNVENAGRYNSMAYLRVGIVVDTFIADSEFVVRVNGGEWSNILQNSSGQYIGWVKIPQIDQYPSEAQYDMEIEIQSNNSGNDWRFKSTVWAYINVNPFDGTTSD